MPPKTCRRALASLLTASLLAAASCSGFRYENYVGELDGALEGIATSARGRAILLVSRDTSRVEISLSVSGFDSPIIAASVRQAPRGQTGAVVFPLWSLGQGPFGNSDPILRVWQRGGSPPLDDAALQALRAGNLYVNVQTRAHPSGEVRGQLLPE